MDVEVHALALLEVSKHNAVEGLRGRRQSTRLAEPLVDGPIAGKPPGAGQARLEVGEHGGGQTLVAGRRPRLFVRQQGGEPPGALGPSPEGNRARQGSSLYTAATAAWTRPGWSQAGYCCLNSSTSSLAASSEDFPCCLSAATRARSAVR